LIYYRRKYAIDANVEYVRDKKEKLQKIIAPIIKAMLCMFVHPCALHTCRVQVRVDCELSDLVGISESFFLFYDQLRLFLFVIQTSISIDQGTRRTSFVVET